MPSQTRLLFITLFLLPLVAPAAMAEVCKDAALAVQVLGSGGPVADSARASSGYLVWDHGRARVLIDAGGGTFQRFGAAGARILPHISFEKRAKRVDDAVHQILARFPPP